MGSLTIEPRLLKKEDAASYCNLSCNAFSQWVREGRLPEAIPKTNRWDKRAIDHKLDQISGLPTNSDVSPLAKWRAENASNS